MGCCCGRGGGGRLCIILGGTAPVCWVLGDRAAPARRECDVL